jgi:hypothetical protein
LQIKLRHNAINRKEAASSIANLIEDKEPGFFLPDLVPKAHPGFVEPEFFVVPSQKA